MRVCPCVEGHVYRGAEKEKKSIFFYLAFVRFRQTASQNFAFRSSHRCQTLCSTSETLKNVLNISRTLQGDAFSYSTVYSFGFLPSARTAEQCEVSGSATSDDDTYTVLPYFLIPSQLSFCRVSFVNSRHRDMTRHSATRHDATRHRPVDPVRNLQR